MIYKNIRKVAVDSFSPDGAPRFSLEMDLLDDSTKIYMAVNFVADKKDNPVLYKEVEENFYQKGLFTTYEQHMLDLKLATPYTNKRAAEYPPLGEQLDMLWHAMDEGALPKIEPFYTQIKEVKDKYSKA